MSIHGIANIGMSGGDFGLSAELQITTPEMNHGEAQALVDVRCALTPRPFAETFGGTEVFEIDELPMPEPKANEARIKVIECLP